MGDSKKLKKQYSTPQHPWQKARIETEKKLCKEYGLKNKQEVYRHDTQIKKIVRHYKKLNYQSTQQSDKEQEQLVARVQRLGYLPQGSDVSSILSMTVENSLDRRLQTLVFKKGLARTIKQARQFITHQHIKVNGKIVDAPGYIVPVSEESKIEFVIRSPLVDAEHPERKIPELEEAKKIKEETKAVKKDEKTPTDDAEQNSEAAEEETPVKIEESAENEGEKNE
ncbi:MAG: 30S ribosomal protein S4 [Candidatus Woesearchaeota archaeon]